MARLIAWEFSIIITVDLTVIRKIINDTYDKSCERACHEVKKKKKKPVTRNSKRKKKCSFQKIKSLERKEIEFSNFFRAKMKGDKRVIRPIMKTKRRSLAYSRVRNSCRLLKDINNNRKKKINKWRVTLYKRYTDLSGMRNTRW